MRRWWFEHNNNAAIQSSSLIDRHLSAFSYGRIAGYTVTLMGSGFIQGSAAKVDGKPQTTSFVSSSELSITLPGTSLAQAATHSITVTNPSPGGGTSASASFSVNNLAPALASFTPSTVAVGSPSTQIELDGSNFLPASTVTFNSTLITSTYVSPTEIVATLPAASLSMAGTQLDVRESGTRWWKFQLYFHQRQQLCR